uniref:Uncharacterized protein n=1 Tax=Panagrolaimus sp. JU765 TaxID=591449 RepID=A0AC34RAF1_9BILA
MTDAHFFSPSLFRDSNTTVWKSVSGLLFSGAYEYIAFEVRSLKANEVIGIDSFGLTEFLGGKN